MPQYNVSLHGITTAINDAKAELAALTLTGSNDTRRDEAMNDLDDLLTAVAEICGTNETSHVMHFEE